jgi:hypothetical protein
MTKQPTKQQVNTMIQSLNEWIGDVVEGFSDYILDLEEAGETDDVCWHCLCDQWCEENATALLNGAFQIGKTEPDIALDFLTERVKFQQVIAKTLLPNLLVAMVEMYYPEDLDTVHHATEK